MLDLQVDMFEDAGRSQKKSKAARRAERRASRATQKQEETKAKPAKALNQTQADYLDALRSSDQVFGIGAAGGGKTYLAANHAMCVLLSGEIDQIIVARPAVSKKKHNLGFLPGKPEEKLAPWLEPVLDGLRAASSASTVERFQREKKIVFCAFEHMRGRTFRNSFVILDEAQNCDIGDLRLFLTRIGEGTKVAVCGDPDQPDIPDSGLEDVLDMIEEYDISAEIIEFGPEDVVRSKIAKEWVRAFDEKG